MKRFILIPLLLLALLVSCQKNETVATAEESGGQTFNEPDHLYEEDKVAVYHNGEGMTETEALMDWLGEDSLESLEQKVIETYANIYDTELTANGIFGHFDGGTSSVLFHKEDAGYFLDIAQVLYDRDADFYDIDIETFKEAAKGYLGLNMDGVNVRELMDAVEEIFGGDGRIINYLDGRYNFSLQRESNDEMVAYILSASKWFGEGE